MVAHHARRLVLAHRCSSQTRDHRPAPAPDFKRSILAAFAEGIAPKPETTFGNVKADVLEQYVPGYKHGNFVDIILNSNWPE